MDKAPRLMNPRFQVEQGRIVSVYGSRVVVDGLYLYDTPTPPPDPKPTPWPQSAQHRAVTEMAAVFVDQGAHDVTVRNSEFSNAAIGIRLRGPRGVATHNYLHDAAKITEQWGAIAIAVVGPDSEVSYNRIENYGFYGGAFANDGAAVELDGEDAAFDGHGAHIHHNISRNTKGGFLEIAANSRDIIVDHNVSDDVDKFIGTNGMRNLRIENNTVIRRRLTDLGERDFWSFKAVFWAVCWNGCEGDRDAGVTVARNIFHLDGAQRIYLSADNPRGFLSALHQDNVYWSPDGDVARIVGQPLERGELIADPRLTESAMGVFMPDRQIARPRAGYFGAFEPGKRPWHAGPK